MIEAAVLAPLAARVYRGCCWIVEAGKPPSRLRQPLTDQRITDHLNGGASVGAIPISPGTSTTRLALLDLDSHKGEVEWADMLDQARAIMEALFESNLYAIPFRSSGGQGIHLYLLWADEQDAYSVREALRIALHKCGLKSGTGGVIKSEVEIFPKQDSVPVDGFGNMFVLPLSRKSKALDPVSLLDVSHTRIQWRGSSPVEVREAPAKVERDMTVAVEHQVLADAVNHIPNSGPQELDYDAWRNLIFSIHSASGGSDSGLAIAHAFSKKSSKYDPDFLDTRVWPYIRDRADGVPADLVLATAQSHGWHNPLVADDFDDLGPLPDEFDAASPPAGAGSADTSGSSDAPRFAVQPWSKFSQGQTPSWLVKDVLPAAGLAVVFGESTSGKTFFALDIAGAVARGVDWRDRKVRRGRVVYICAEGVHGFRNRMRAYVQSNDLDDIDIGVIPAAPNFMVADDIKDVLRAVYAHGVVDLVVVDTFAQVMPGANENSAEDVGKALKHCRVIHEKTGALVMLIHHSGKDAAKGARGWSGLRAAADAEIEITRVDHERSARVSKLKDGEDGAEFGFKLETVQVGLDADNASITSCVVHHTSAPARAKRDKGPRGAVQKIVLKALDALVNDLAGEGGMVPEAQLLMAAVELQPRGSGERDPRKQNTDRAIRELLSGGFLVLSDGKIGLADSGLDLV